MSLPNDPNFPDQSASPQQPWGMQQGPNPQQAAQAQTAGQQVHYLQEVGPRSPASAMSAHPTDQAHAVYERAKDQIHAQLGGIFAGQPMGNILAAFLGDLLQKLGPVLVQIILNVLQHQGGLQPGGTPGAPVGFPPNQPGTFPGT